MFVAAAIPGPAVLIVVGKSLSQGFRASVATATGVMLGDFILILLTVLGLSSLSALLGGFFVFIKYAGGLYLIWLGINLIRSGLRQQQPIDQLSNQTNHKKSFAVGLITALSNPKALFFYASLFPNLVNLSNITLNNFLLIELFAVSAVGSVMIGYGFIASQSKNIFSSSASKYLQTGVGCIFIGSGIYIATRT